MMALLEAVFRLVIALSFAGSFGVLLVLGGKAALKDRLSPGWSYGLWALPLTLFLVPFALPVREAAAFSGAGKGTSLGAPSTGAALSIPQPLPVEGPLPGLWQSLCSLWDQLLPVLAWVWLLGLLFLAAVRLADHHALTRSLSRCSCPPQKDGAAERAFLRITRELEIPQGKVELLLCPGVGSPLLLGLLRPRVLLPQEDYPEEQLLMMLRHELTHYRSRDLWVKAVALGTACLHWFNPLAWLLVRELDRCGELRCDHRTTRTMTAGEKKRYGRMLLDVAQGEHLAAPSGAVTLAMDRGELKRRLTLLKSPRKPAPLDRAVSLALALTVAVTGVVCSSAVNPGPVFAGLFQEEVPPPAPAGENEPPLLWEGIQESIAPKSSPSIQMKAVLSDQVTAPGSTPESKPEAAPESAPESTPEAAPESAPDPGEEAQETLESAPVPESSAPEPEQKPDPAPEPEIVPEPEPEIVPEREDLHWTGGFLWPVDGGYVSAGYNSYYGHSGMDIAADPGTSIFAAASGEVVYASDTSIWPYGKSVLIDHGDGMTTRYAHCKQVLVSVGDWVDQGQVIALVGRTGNATGNHCHFEVIQDGEHRNPAEYIAG